MHAFQPFRAKCRHKTLRLWIIKFWLGFFTGTKCRVILSKHVTIACDSAEKTVRALKTCFHKHKGGFLHRYQRHHYALRCFLGSFFIIASLSFFIYHFSFSGAHNVFSVFLLNINTGFCVWAQISFVLSHFCLKIPFD